MILTNYHRLATIVESLRLGIVDNIENQKVDDSQKLNEELDKLKIISELEFINSSGSEEGNNRSRKLSEEYTKDSQTETAQLHSDFSKYISNYCTVYLDFDSHSDEFFSYLVDYNLILRNITGKIKARIF
jgi:hypothetical protein